MAKNKRKHTGNKAGTNSYSGKFRTEYSKFVTEEPFAISKNEDSKDADGFVFVPTISEETDVGEDNVDYYENSDADSGQNDAGSGQNDAGSGLNDAAQKQNDAGSGQSSAGRGQNDAGSGQSSAGSGQNDAGSGQNSVGRGQNDAEREQNDADSGQNDAGSGQNDAENAAKQEPADDREFYHEGTDTDTDEMSFSDEINNSKRKKKRNRKRVRIVLFIIELVVLILAIAALLIVTKVEKVKKISIQEDNIKQNISSSVKKNAETGQMKGYTNIALFGVDTRVGELSKDTRSDTILIASINNDTGNVKLLSVYRDTYLNLGNGNYNKCNSAYAYGGPEQAINMLNMNFDLNITDFVTVGFGGLVDAIDALGGLDLELTDAEIPYLNDYEKIMAKQQNMEYIPVTESGLQHLNGLQATAYCRIRYTSGDDFKRTERQRIVLDALFKKASKATPSQLTAIADDVFEEIYTSMDLSEILSYLVNIGNYSIESKEGVPQESMRATGSVGRKGSCVIPITLESNAVWVHHFLFNDYGYQPSDEVQEYSRVIVEDTGLGNGGSSAGNQTTAGNTSVSSSGTSDAGAVSSTGVSGDIGAQTGASIDPAQEALLQQAALQQQQAALQQQQQAQTGSSADAEQQALLQQQQALLQQQQAALQQQQAVLQQQQAQTGASAQ